MTIVHHEEEANREKEEEDDDNDVEQRMKERESFKLQWIQLLHIATQMATER